MFVIAADGSADFKTMADAARALPDGALVVYREGEHEENAVFAQNGLLIVGEHTGRTRARGRIVFTGKDAIAESITFVDHVEGAGYIDCVVDGQAITNASRAPIIWLLGDRCAPCEAAADTRDCRLPGYSVKRFITEKRLNYAELCFHPGDAARYCLSPADCSSDIRDRADPLLVYPHYLAMIANAARESGVRVTFVLDPSRRDAHAAAARTFCQSRNLSLEEASR